MDEAIQTELDKLKELIINAIPVEQIYLFGSYAFSTHYCDNVMVVFIKRYIPKNSFTYFL